MLNYLPFSAKNILIQNMSFIYIMWLKSLDSHVTYKLTLVSSFFRRVQANQVGFKLNGTHQLLVYAEDNISGESIYTIKKNV
jgi:hypothetical protein